MKKVRPNSEYVTLLLSAPEGIAEELTVSVVGLEDGNPVDPPSSDGITEISAPSGNYTKVITLPDEEGIYVVQWNHGDIEILDNQVLQVIATAPVDDVPLPASYATVADLEAYLEDGLPAGYDTEYFEKLLVKASQDIDDWANYFPVLPTSVRKFAKSDDPFEWHPWLEGYSRLAFIEATCAQAEYRLAKGDQFFVEHQNPRSKFNEPRMGPKAVEALRRTGFALRVRTAVMR